MYKTVRKGDASLQYTILPQTDQFFGNIPSPSPPPSERSQLLVYKMTSIVVIIVIFICCVAATLLVNHTHRGILVGVAMSQIDHEDLYEKSEKSNDSILEIGSNFSEHSNDEINTKISSTLISNNLEGDLVPIMKDEITSTLITHEEIEASTLMGNPMTEENISTSTTSIPTSEVNEVKNSDTSNSSFQNNSQSTFLASENSVETSRSTFEDSTTSSSSTAYFKKAKMPRVTLKLRENETIPQMYMKAGIASYKKGNITTSVLAHGLSLEGLIFKTPEGTIKPWSEKWPFSESSSYAQWKRDNVMREQIFAVLVTLMVVSVMIFCILSLAQLKAARRRWHDIEESPLVEREEVEQGDTSKLLEIGGRDSDKE